MPTLQQIVAWLLSHVQDEPALLAAFQAFESATGVAAKWAALRTLIGMIVADMADFPAPNATAQPTAKVHLANLDALGKLANINWANVLAIITQILAIIKGISPTPAP